jgi:hypothetical protein
VEDARHQRLAQLGAGAEKSADLGRDGRALDGQFRPKEPWIAILAVRASVAEPCRPGVAQSVERSCAAPEAVAQPQPEARRDAAQPEVPTEPPELLERPTP